MLTAGDEADRERGRSAVGHTVNGERTLAQDASIEGDRPPVDRQRCRALASQGAFQRCVVNEGAVGQDGEVLVGAAAVEPVLASGDQSDGEGSRGVMGHTVQGERRLAQNAGVDLHRPSVDCQGGRAAAAQGAFQGRVVIDGAVDGDRKVLIGAAAVEPVLASRDQSDGEGSRDVMGHTVQGERRLA